MADQPATDTTVAQQPTNNRDRRTPRPRTTPSAGRLTYTRRATAGNKPDRIVNPAWYLFLIVMLAIGGTATLAWILFGGFQWGRASAPTPAPHTVTSPAPPVAPVPVATPPAPVQPQVIQQVAYPPPPSQATNTSSVATRPLSDAEQRNEALKERLRRRHGIE